MSTQAECALCYGATVDTHTTQSRPCTDAPPSVKWIDCLRANSQNERPRIGRTALWTIIEPSRWYIVFWLEACAHTLEGGLCSKENAIDQAKDLSENATLLYLFNLELTDRLESAPDIYGACQHAKHS